MKLDLGGFGGWLFTYESKSPEKVDETSSYLLSDKMLSKWYKRSRQTASYLLTEFHPPMAMQQADGKMERK